MYYMKYNVLGGARPLPAPCFYHCKGITIILKDKCNQLNPYVKILMAEKPYFGGTL